MSKTHFQLPDGRWQKRPEPADEPQSVKITYMRDNHTFRSLPLEVEGAMKILRDEFSAGNTYGMLCGYPKGVVDSVVHARDQARWHEFEIEAREWLESTIELSEPPSERIKGE